MPQAQNERRKHVVYLTAHTEYHCRDRECVGVRDRRTGEWKRWHVALRGRLLGSLDAQRAVVREPRVGHRLLFMGRERILTSRLQRTVRPPLEALRSYSSFSVTGAIHS